MADLDGFPALGGRSSGGSLGSSGNVGNKKAGWGTTITEASAKGARRRKPRTAAGTDPAQPSIATPSTLHAILLLSTLLLESSSPFFSPPRQLHHYLFSNACLTALICEDMNTTPETCGLDAFGSRSHLSSTNGIREGREGKGGKKKEQLKYILLCTRFQRRASIPCTRACVIISREIWNGKPPDHGVVHERAREKWRRRSSLSRRSPFPFYKST